MSPTHRTLLTFDGPVYAACLSGGRYLVAVVLDEPSLLCVDLDTGNVPDILELGANAQTIGDLASHPSKPWVAVCGSGRPLEVWDIEDQRPILTIGDNQSHYLGLAFSACGEFLETHDGFDDVGVRLSLASGQIVGQRWGDVGDIAVAGELVAVGVGDYARTVYLGEWRDANMRWYRRALELPVPAGVHFGPGVIAAIGGFEALHLFVHDFPACTARFSISLGAVDEQTLDALSPSEALAFGRDGRACFVPGPTGELLEIDLRSGETRRRWRAHERMVVALAMRGDTLISAGADGRVVCSTLDPSSGDDAQSLTDSAVEGFVASAEVVEVDDPGRNPDSFEFFESQEIS